MYIEEDKVNYHGNLRDFQGDTLIVKEYTEQDSNVICSTFMCGKKLSLTEKLCGYKCLSCMTKHESIDVTKIIKITITEK
jgi:hypothetical protein